MAKSSLILALLLVGVLQQVRCEVVDVEDADGVVVKKEGEKSESWTGWAKEKLSEGLGFGAAQTGEKVSQKASDAGQYAEDKGEAVYEGAERRASEDKAEDAAEAAERRASEAKETAQEHLGWAKEKAGEGYESAKHKAEDAAEAAKRRAAEAKERGAGWAKEKAKQGYESAKERVSSDHEL